MVAPSGNPPTSPEYHSVLPYQDFLDMPHEDLAIHAFDLQRILDKNRGIIGSLARLQLRLEGEHATEVGEMEYAAELDDLTGLLNKRALIDRVEVLVESGETEFGVIFIDLSKFKLVNDTLGHVEGDKILQKTAGVLETTLRHDDLTHDLGRYGGDEFAILCDLESREGSTDPSTIKLEKIIERLRTNFVIMTKDNDLDSLGFDVAIGGVVFETGMTPEDLLKKADKVMYADKYSRTEKLTKEEILELRAVQHLLTKAGVRLPDEIS